ncbi:MAG: BamA/TamA family outer membrane protein [Bacteroidales bacterium]
MIKRVYIYIALQLCPVMNLTAQHILYVYHMDPAVVFCDSFRVSDSIEAVEKLKYLQQADLNDGYFFAGYDSIVYNNQKVEAWYRSGVKYYWDTVVIKKNDSFPAVEISPEDLMASPPSPDRVREWTTKVHKMLFDLGFPDAQVKVDSIAISDDHKIKIHVDIYQGEKLFFDGFIFPEYNDFPSALLPVKTGLHPGEVFQGDKLNTIDKVLNELEFVKPVDKWFIERHDSLFNIVVPLKKEKANNFNGMLGIIPGDEVQNLYLTGHVDLNLLNVFKQAEHILFHWKAPDKASQKLNVLLDFPLIYRQFGAESAFSIEKKDTSFLDVGFMGQVNYLYGSNKTGLFYEYKSQQSISGDMNANNGNIQTSIVGLAYGYSNLDYVQNPAMGMSADLKIAAGNSHDLDKDINRFKSKCTLDFQYYYPLNAHWSIRVSHASGIILSEQLYDNEIFRMGGHDLFRAYPEYAFWTPWYGSLAMDMLFYPDKYSSLFLFVEAGMLDSKRGIITDDFCALSLGSGLNVNTSLGVLTLSYAVGRTKQSFIDFRQSQIFIGYKNNF